MITLNIVDVCVWRGYMVGNRDWLWDKKELNDELS